MSTAHQASGPAAGAKSGPTPDQPTPAEPPPETPDLPTLAEPPPETPDRPAPELPAPDIQSHEWPTPDWGDLLAVALVGTARRRLPGADEGERPEQAVLAAAAVAGAERRAGYLPVAAAPGPEPAADEPTTPAPPVAAEVLEMVLDGAVDLPGGSEPMLVAWLERAAATGHHPPHRLLPALLERGRYSYALRRPVAQATGPRARWLAAQNPDWDWVAVFAEGPVPDDERDRVWATGRPAARLGLLAQVRAVDRPAALDLARSGWAGEKAADRLAMVGVVAASVGPDDEDFLESLLDDRSAKVRVAAARALDCLPASARAGRMAARTLPLLTRSGGRRPTIEVRLPAEIDEATRRDGVIDTDAPPRTGTGSWRLIQMLRATPLDRWVGHLGAPPERIVAMAATTAEVLEGWAAAAVAQKNREWAAAVFAVRPSADLLVVLDPDDADALALAVLPQATKVLLAEIVVGLPGPWSRRLSEAVVERVDETDPTPDRMARLAPALSVSLDPAVAAAVGDLAGRTPSYPVAAALRGVRRALDLRATILQELK